MTGRDPVAQTIKRPRHHFRMAEIERVAAAGPVMVATAFPQPVVAGVVHAAHRQRRADLLQLCGMVQHHIQHHLDAGGVQVFYRLLELLQRAAASFARRIARLQRPERIGVVAPIVAQTKLLEARLVGKLRHRLQLQRGNAQPLKIADNSRMPQRRVSAALRFQNFRMSLRQPAHVRLIDDGFAPGHTRRDVIAPVKILLHHYAFRRHRCAVAVVALPFAAVETRVVRHRAFHRARAGIDQQLGGIEAVSLLRRPWAVHAVAVALARRQVRKIPMPDVIRTRRQVIAALVPFLIEKTELHALSMLRKKRKVDPLSIPGRAQGKGFSGIQVTHSASLISQMVASGGSVRESECSRLWLGTGSLQTVPLLPILLP